MFFGFVSAQVLSCGQSIQHSDHVFVGIHGVLVRIRDDDLKTMPGVRVEDMG